MNALSWLEIAALISFGFICGYMIAGYRSVTYAAKMNVAAYKRGLVDGWADAKWNAAHPVSEEESNGSVDV
jgi:hypothetical protein